MARGDFHLLFVHLLPQIFLKAESRNHVITFLPRFRRNGKREWNKKKKEEEEDRSGVGAFFRNPLFFSQGLSRLYQQERGEAEVASVAQAFCSSPWLEV